MGSLWHALSSDLKYFAVMSPFMMYDSMLFNRVLIDLMKVFPNLYLFKAKI